MSKSYRVVALLTSIIISSHLMLSERYSPRAFGYSLSINDTDAYELIGKFVDKTKIMDKACESYHARVRESWKLGNYQFRAANEFRRMSTTERLQNDVCQHEYLEGVFWVALYLLLLYFSWVGRFKAGLLLERLTSLVTKLISKI
jgi:hypothetical protein